MFQFLGSIIIYLLTFLAICSFALGGFFLFKKKKSYDKQVERALKMIPLLVTVPAKKEVDSSRDQREVVKELISQAETMFSSLSSIYKKGFRAYIHGQKHVAFEIIAKDKEILFYVVVPAVLLDLVEKSITAQYPNAHVEQVSEHNIFSQRSKIHGVEGCVLKLRKPSYFPIKTYQELDSEPLDALTNALSKLKEEEGVGIQVLVRPVNPKWYKTSESICKKMQEGEYKSSKGFGGVFSFGKSIGKDLFKAAKGDLAKDKEKDFSKEHRLTPYEEKAIQNIQKKSSKPVFETVVRIVVSSENNRRSKEILSGIQSAFSQFNSPNSNSFKILNYKSKEKLSTDFIFRFFGSYKNSMILSIEELASFFHFPNFKVETPNIKWLSSQKATAPANLPSSGTILGDNVYRGVENKVYLTENDKCMHAYIIGQTGTGKSTLMENMAIDDIKKGKGVCVIDPHGQTIDHVVSAIPKERAEDVVIFDAGDTERPLGLNLFEFSRPEQKDFLIQEAINMLYKLYDPGHTGIIGPRYEHWFRNAALTLMADPAGSTFIEVPRIFIDKDFLEDKLKHVTDPTVRDFWSKEMAQTSDFHKSEILGWFVSKFGAFMGNEIMRNIIGQVNSAFDFRKIMDEQKILLVNLSKGKIGEINSMLLGMIFVSKIQMAALSRADIPESQRKSFYLYVDEFQNFSTDSFASILSEARKYKLSLVVANQYIGQIREDIRNAVFGNVGTLVSFRVGAEDAEFLSKQFEPVFGPEDLINIENFNAYIKLMINGVPSKPFSMRGLPPQKESEEKVIEAIRQLSRLKFGKKKEIVEEDIKKRLSGFSLPQSPSTNRDTREA